MRPNWHANRGKGKRLLLAVAAAAMLGTPGRAQLLLPAPGGDPAAIDFSQDPLLRLLAADTGAAGDDFRAVVAAAVLGYPAVPEADAQSDVLRANRREARSALFPVLNASLYGSRTLARELNSNSTIAESLVPNGRIDAQIGADQLIYDFGATGGRIAGASARLRAAKAETGRAATDTALAAVSAWYQVIGYQALTELSDATVARHRSIVADAKTRLTAGLGSGSDLARAEAGLADAMGAAANGARNLAAARARFHELFGAVAPLRPRRAVLPTSVAGDADAAAIMSHASPPVVAALAAVDAANADVTAARGDSLPRLSAGIAATRYAAFDGNGNFDVRGQFSLRQTLSTGGAEAARRDAAKARASAARFAGDRIIAGAEREAETAFADARILDGALDALGDAYRANRRSRDAIAEQYRLGRIGLGDLLRSDDDYFAASRALLLGTIERDIARYTLLARTGELLRHFGIAPGEPSPPARPSSIGRP